MRRLIPILIILLWLPSAAKAEPLLADLSEHIVKITTGFTGTKVLLFGAIEGEGKVIVIVKGPEEDVTVRRKEPVAGVWVNREVVEFAGVPSFYQVLSSEPLADWLPRRTRARFHIGTEYLGLRPIEAASPAEGVLFREALIRNLRRDGRYGMLEGSVKIMGGRLFRADLYLPANLPTGFYNVEVLLVDDGEVKDIQSTPLLVSKSGLEAQIFWMAYDFPALYGIAAIVIAVLAGLGANAVFRKV
jgi:uncharacterized protein (TIGR02186 family)